MGQDLFLGHFSPKTVENMSRQMRLVSHSKTPAFLAVLHRLKARFNRKALLFFYDPISPQAYVMAQALDQLQKKMPFLVEVKLVSGVPAAFHPIPSLAWDYEWEDAKREARRYGLHFFDQKTIPSKEVCDHAYETLCKKDLSLSDCLEASKTVFVPNSQSTKKNLKQKTQHLFYQQFSKRFSEPIEQRLSKNRRLQHALNSFYVASVYYKGESYWHIDRLAFLLPKLRGKGDPVLNQGINDIFPSKLNVSPLKKVSPVKDLVAYVSFNSPYTYLSLAKLDRLQSQYFVHIQFKPLLPMLMRGMDQSVRLKAISLLTDAARIARQDQIGYGKVYSPVGCGVKCAMALFYMAKKQGREAALFNALMQASWNEGLNIAGEEVLKTIVRRLALNWHEAKKALADFSWQDHAKTHEKNLNNAGHWGVPSFQLEDTLVFGQDRLCYIKEKLVKRKEPLPLLYPDYFKS